MKAMLRLFAVLTVAVSMGCGSDLGECDMTEAMEVVYLTTPRDRTGEPAYAGQALTYASCAGGAFCHSSTTTGVSRYGAPAGLDFDVKTACTGLSGEDCGAETLRLVNAVHDSEDWADDMLDEVEAGTMPPRGELTDMVLTSLKSFWVYERADGSALPAIDSSEGKEIFRNWLACGAPVVERTSDGPTRIGDVVPARMTAGP